jgi:2-iminoacetate synthase
MQSYSRFDLEEYLGKISDADIHKTLEKDKLSEMDLLNLLSDQAIPYLEKMAQKAQKLTIQNFGKTIQLYIPLYLSNYCSNECVYCGFSKKNKIERKILSKEEIEKNALEIKKTGIKHLLILTGETPQITPIEYLLDAFRILNKHFSSVSIEIFPLQTEEYKLLQKEGVDGLTIYQETYDMAAYEKLHLSGKKKDYLYRLETPERGAEAGFRSINIGALFGLADPVKEAFFTGLHASYLQNKYLGSEISVSLPRLNEAEGGFKALFPLSDKKFVQFILAYRLFLPRIGITLSTRESANMRDHLISLGVTKMSAGSMTCVGGYLEGNNAPQFEISDSRSVAETTRILSEKGYEAIFKDWQ